MPDEPDITAPELTPVTTQPTLAPVAETAALLEPVPGNTLELEDDEDAPSRTIDDEPPKDAKPRKAAVKAPMRGDGFDGASLPNLPSAPEKTPEQRQQTVRAFQLGAWVLVALMAVGVLLILGLLVQLL